MLFQTKKETEWPLREEEEQPLRLSDELDAHQNQSSPTQRHRSFGWLKLYVVVLHILLFVVLAFFLRGYLKSNNGVPLQGATWSPAQDIVEYEVSGQHSLQHQKDTIYSRPPSAEQDEAWNELLSPTYFEATREEMTMAEETLGDSVLEINTGGYLAALGVYHELHCLRQLRLNLYQDWYYPNMTSKQDKWLHIHLDHCIETLRMLVMCHGNIGLYSFEWELPEKKRRPTTKSNSRSVCVKWDSIESWGRSRMLTEEQQIKSNPFYNATL